jgi:hypothetical protein
MYMYIYLNNQATKYFLEADKVQDGMNTIAMFTKHEGDAEKTLYELQVFFDTYAFLTGR